MNPRDRVNQLRSAGKVVLPSILLCDFGDLKGEVQRLEDAGVSGFHLDVMDGHFVPNLTYGFPIVDAFRQLTDLPLDVHLMISQPEKYVAQFVDSGADLITIHTEATDQVESTLQKIQSLNAGCGIALNPNTPLTELDGVISQCDLILVMSVDAGFGGQSFNPIALEKLSQLKAMKSEQTLLEVDGGINASTIGKCAEAGADLFVVGSGIFRKPDYGTAITELNQKIQSTFPQV